MMVEFTGEVDIPLTDNQISPGTDDAATIQAALNAAILIIAAILPASATSISMSGTNGAESFSDSSTYGLSKNASMESYSSNGQTLTSIQGAGVVTHNGLTNPRYQSLPVGRT